MRSLPMVRYGNDWLLVSGRVEHRSAKSRAMQGCGCARWPCYKWFCRNSFAVMQAAVVGACRLVLLVAGDLQGFVDDQQLQIVCT